MIPYTSTLIEDWRKTCKYVLDESFNENEKRKKKQTSFEDSPHTMLIELIKTHHDLIDSPTDPSVYDTIEFLKELVSIVNSDEREHVRYLITLVSEAHSFYEDIMRKYCYEKAFCRKELLHPGYTKTFFMNITFKKALVCSEFTTYVRSSFHPKLRIFRSVSRGLSGLSTTVVKSTATKAVNTTESSVPILSDAVYDTANSTMNTLKDVWTHNINALQECEGLVKEQAELEKDVNALFGGLVSKVKMVNSVLSDTKAVMTPPVVSLETSAWKAVESLLNDWKSFVKAGATKDDIVCKRKEQEKEMRRVVVQIYQDTIDCITNEKATHDGESMEAMRLNWVELLLKARLYPAISQCLAENYAPSTQNMFMDTTSYVSRSFPIVEAYADKLNITTGNIQSIVEQAQLVSVIPPIDNMMHTSVKSAWENAIKDAVRMDVAFYMKSFCQAIEQTPMTQLLTFIDEQLQLKRISEGNSQASLAINECFKSVSAEATIILQQTYHKSLHVLTLKLYASFTTLHKLADNQLVKMKEETQEKMMEFIHKNNTNTQDHVGRLLDLELNETNTKKALDAMNDVWRQLMQHKEENKEDSSEVMAHFRNALVESSDIINKEKTIQLRLYTALCSMLIGAASLNWIITTNKLITRTK